MLWCRFLHGLGLQSCSALAGLVLFAGMVQSACAMQAAVTQPPSLEQQIDSEMTMIREADQRGFTPLQVGRLWAKLASDYEEEMQFAKSESAYNRALGLLEAYASERVDYAVVLDNLGTLYEMTGNYAESERCRRRSLAAREKLGDKLEIARGRAHLAEVELGQHRYKDAEQDASDAYGEMVAVKDADADDLVSTLVTLIYAECGHSNCNGALEHAREASSLALRALAADSLPVGQTHLALGYAEWRTGMKDGPDEEMREGIRIMKARMAPSHPYVLSALEQYRTYLEAVHRGTEAKEIEQEEKQLQTARLTGCGNCTVSVYGLH